MTESRNDLVMRMIEDIAFLSARLTGLKAMGLVDEAIKNLENLKQQADKLEGPNSDRLKAALNTLRAEM